MTQQQGAIDFSDLGGETVNAPPPTSVPTPKQSTATSGVDFSDLGGQSTAAVAGQAKSKKEKPGYFKRLGQSLGVPTSKEELEAAKPSTLEQQGGPAVTAGKMIWNYGKNVAHAAEESYHEAKDAGQNIAEGGPVGANLAKGAYAGLHLGLQAVPFIGPPTETAGEDIQDKNYAGAAGGLTGVVGQVAAASEPGQKVIDKGTALVKSAPKAIADTTRSALGIVNPDALTAEQSATKAVKSRKVNPEKLKTALPDTRRAADKLGIDTEKIDFQGAENSTRQGMRDVWDEYEKNYLGPNKKAVVDASPVAKEIRNTVSARTVEQNPALADKVNKIADTYEGRELPLSELEERVQELNNETRSIEANYPSDKAAAQREPKWAYKYAEKNALRNLLQSKLDELAGPGSAELKQRYGNLKSFQDAIQRRRTAYEAQNPEGLGEQIGRFEGIGQMVKGGVKMAKGSILDGAADIAGGFATRRAARAARQANDSQFLLRQALRKTKPSDPMVPRYQGEYIDDTPPTPVAPPKLPSGQYEAQPTSQQSLSNMPASPIPGQKSLPGHIIDGEYMNEPADVPRRPTGMLPGGVYEQPGSFEPTQPALPAKSAIPLPESTPHGPVSRFTMAEGEQPGRPMPQTPDAQPTDTSLRTNKWYQQAKRELQGRNVPEQQIIDRAEQLKRAQQPLTDTPYGGENKIVTTEQANAARKRLNDKMFRSNAGFDPTMLADAAKLGVYHVEAGLREFGEWSKKMIDELGDGVKPHLEALFKQSMSKDESVNAPAFYSKALKTIEQKVSTGNGDSILSTLRNAGVKEDEIRWSGLDDFLKGKAKVTKSDVQQFMQENQIQLSEKKLGAGKVEIKPDRHAGKLIKQVANDVEGNAYDDAEEGGEHLDGNLEEAKQISALAKAVAEGNGEEAANLYNGLDEGGARMAVKEALGEDHPLIQQLENSGDGAPPAHQVEDAINNLNERSASFQQEAKEMRKASDFDPEDDGPETDAMEEDSTLLAEIASALEDGDWDEARQLYRDAGPDLREFAGDDVGPLHDFLMNESNQGGAKYAKYTLPGDKKNYTELLMQLPNKDTPAKLPKATITERETGGQFKFRVQLGNQTALAPDRASAEAIAHHLESNPENTANRITELPPNYKFHHNGTVNQPWEVVDNDTGEVITGHNSYGTKQQAKLKALEKLNEQKKPVFKSSHFDEPNILAHVRFDERTDAQGKRVLLVEEVQSDWHQKGKKEGYIHPKSAAASVGQEPGGGMVPDAPFKSDWHELAMKRMIRYAAEHGYNKLAWVTGEQTAERYSLANQVDNLQYDPSTETLFAYKGEDNARGFEQGKKIPKDKLEDYVGKSIAEKLLDSKNEDLDTGLNSVKGDNLKISPTWAKNLYDHAIPNFMSKYGKKWGARVGETTLDVGTAGLVDVLSGTNDRAPLDTSHKVHSIDITPEMKRSVLKEGQPISANEPNPLGMFANRERVS